MAERLKAKTPDSILENNKIKAIYPQIIVTGKTDKPYYSIAYYDTAKKEWYIGYSSYELKYVRQWFNEFFEEVEGDMAEVVHGEWVNIANYGINDCYATCSVCKTPIKTRNPLTLRMDNKYCGWCGAKMDGTDINDGSKTSLPESTR